MINVASTRAAISALPGDVVAVGKDQLGQLLDELETRQRAQRTCRDMTRTFMPRG